VVGVLVGEEVGYSVGFRVGVVVGVGVGESVPPTHAVLVSWFCVEYPVGHEMQASKFPFVAW